MPVALAIDFGSTYTKVVAIDVGNESVLGVVQAPTTVDDVTAGLGRALDLLEATTGFKGRDSSIRVACSSAAGGLRMVAIGLVPDLTAEAAKLAALGAGAKVVRVYSYELTAQDTREIVRIAPDMIMLAGGTDGGDRRVILANAATLAGLAPRVPIVVCGNRAVTAEVRRILDAAGCTVETVDNVLPELGRLNVDPAREAIRRIFMERITHAKGLDKAEEFVGRIAMPTPMAVLEGARLLADGRAGEPGYGDLVVVDVGGATTDVHSISIGAPSNPRMVPRGLPEPYAKRTVEGDLGIRVNAPTILDSAGANAVSAAVAAELAEDFLRAHVQQLARDTEYVPRKAWEHEVDAALAGIAVDLAMARHAGRVETLHTPDGPLPLLYGKDLSKVRTVVATGGVFAHGSLPGRILPGARYRAERPLSLRPVDPAFLIDARYILFAAGLIGPAAPAAMIRIMKRNLKQVQVDEGAAVALGTA